VVIASALRPEDRGFEYRQGVRFFWILHLAMLLFMTENALLCVFEDNKKGKRYFFKNGYFKFSI
jgi:hypothetical protein